MGRSLIDFLPKEDSPPQPIQLWQARFERHYAGATLSCVWFADRAGDRTPASIASMPDEVRVASRADPPE